MEQPNPSGANDGTAAGHLEEVEGYEELDVHHDHHDLRRDMLQRIVRNDPIILGLNANWAYSPAYRESDEAKSEWWGQAGNAIGANTHLRSLSIDAFDDEPSAALGSFCTGLANNRSIERLCIYECDLIDSDIFSALSPFFEQNSNLRSIVLDCCDLDSRGARSLASALAKCDKNTLKHITLEQVDINDQVAAEFIESLSHHHGLVNLSLCRVEIGRSGCAALANLINNSEVKVQELSLCWCENVDDECMSILSHALGRTNSLRKLDLSGLNDTVGPHVGGSIASAGWCTVLAALCNPMCLLKELSLRHAELGDQCLVVFGHALAVNTKLKSLDITGSETESGLPASARSWRAFWECLQSPTSALEKLCTAQCNVTDEGAIAMATTLTKNKALKCLDISNNRSITPAGWRTCFHLLKYSALEELCLESNSIDDDGIAALVEAFAHNNSLKILQLRDCPRVSAGGWQQMSTLVQRPSTSLTELSLEENVNDEVIIRFSSALLNNSSLKVLRFGGNRDIISVRGWQALSDALCNTTSINDTHSSNHTLQTIQRGSALGSAGYTNISPQNVSRLLMMNRNENKREVARQKILEHHFCDPETDIGVFAGLELRAMPRVIEWIGRDYLGLSLLYHLSRSMASLFESNTKHGTNVAGGKRKLEC